MSFIRQYIMQAGEPMKRYGFPACLAFIFLKSVLIITERYGKMTVM